MATPTRRTGLSAHSSASQRLCARAPADRERRVEPTGGADTRPERRAGEAGDGIGVGEDHLADDTIGVELLVAALAVPRAGQPLGVLRQPPVGELVAGARRRRRVASLEHVVERRPLVGIDVRSVLLGGQPRVGSRRR